MKRSVDERVGAVAWPSVVDALESQGAAIVKSVISPDECATLAGLVVARATPRREGAA
jgi:hypothetical protein